MAGEMSLSKPFVKGDKNHLLILPEIGGPVHIVAQCSDRTEGPVRLEGSIQSWGQGCYPLWPPDSLRVMGAGTPLTSRIGV